MRLSKANRVASRGFPRPPESVGFRQGRFLAKSHGVSVVARTKDIFAVLLLLSPVACSGPPDWVPESGATDMSIASGPPGSGPALSAEAQRVSQIAAREGDRDYLMLDKPHGRIIVFEAGRPTFSGAALTGENPADFLAPDAKERTFRNSMGIKYKVTPAGRYTVSPGFDAAYGDTLDVNEVQGPDWDISIHRVWLGAPSEHRDLRLRTASTQDKHITYGCIDVDGNTMKQLLARVPDEEDTPLYILPEDENLITQIFPPHNMVSKVSSDSGS